MNKINWPLIKDSPIWIISIIVTASVSSTFYIVNNLIVAHYKLEIQRLEKIIDQQKQINNLDSITISLRNILEIQTNLIEMKHSNSNQKSNGKKNINIKWINRIDNLIATGNSLLILETSSNQTLDLFNSWRDDCNSLLNQIDFELKTGYVKDFSTLTKLEIAEYPQLRTKVNDGLSLIKTIRMYY